MRTRTIALVSALALVPAGAFADRHPLDCFAGGYLYASDDMKALTISCGFYVKDFDDLVPSRTWETEQQPSPPPAPPRSGERQSATTSTSPDEPHETFLVPEYLRFTDDARNGEKFARDVWTIGVRRHFGTGRMQPYAQVGIGIARTTLGVATDSGFAFTGTAGVDARLAKLGRHDLMLRASCGAVRTSGSGSPETVAHCSPSLGIRFNERP